eukprot:6184886-Pleurochrysis_carterae.AAC.1
MPSQQPCLNRRLRMLSSPSIHARVATRLRMAGRPRRNCDDACRGAARLSVPLPAIYIPSSSILTLTGDTLLPRLLAPFRLYPRYIPFGNVLQVPVCGADARVRDAASASLERRARELDGVRLAKVRGRAQVLGRRRARQ